MPRPCSVCTHPKRYEAEEALAGGDSLRAVAKQFGMSASALHRHKAAHLKADQGTPDQTYGVGRVDAKDTTVLGDQPTSSMSRFDLIEERLARAEQSNQTLATAVLRLMRERRRLV